MAKRASLSFDAVKASKGAPAAEASPAADLTKPEVGAGEKRGRGRPVKRSPDAGKVYGMTLRIPGNLRKAMRRLAENETEARGRIVSVHDVILQAVEAHLSRKGVKVED